MTDQINPKEHFKKANDKKEGRIDRQQGRALTRAKRRGWRAFRRWSGLPRRTARALFAQTEDWERDTTYHDPNLFFVLDDVEYTVHFCRPNFVTIDYVKTYDRITNRMSSKIYAVSQLVRELERIDVDRYIATLAEHPPG